PHTEHWNQSVPQGGSDLARENLVGFRMHGTAFRVPHENVAALERGEECTGDLTRVGTGVVLRQILCAVDHVELVGPDEVRNGTDVSAGRDHRYFRSGESVVVVRVLERPCELLHEGDRLLLVEVHLPVARDQRNPACYCHPRTSSPGRRL